MKRLMIVSLVLLSFLGSAQAQRFCTMEFAVMINDETGQCLPGTNGCRIKDLMKAGFRRAQEGECSEEVDTRPDNRICTMEFAIMINEVTGQCLPGNNGCVIGDLIKKGFRRATAGECAI